MRCGFCVTLRSAVFFGASIHIFLGAIQFLYFFMQTANYVRYARRPEQTSLTWTNFLILLMGAIFLPLGCLIFRGVEKEKLNLIRIPMWLFFLCKGLELCLKAYQEGVLTHPDRKVGWETRLYQTIDVTGSVAYFLLLFFYAKALAQGRGDGGEDYYKTSDVDDDTSYQRQQRKANKLLG